MRAGRSSQQTGRATAGTQQSEIGSAWRVAGPYAGGDRALHADLGVPCQAVHASRVGAFSRPARVHQGGLQGVGPVAWLLPYASCFVPLLMAEFRL